MRRALVALLLTLTAVSAHAQTVTLSACNPGKTAVDVYFAQGANLVSQHVAPADCATLATSKGAMSPGVVAVGFANVQGQWGGVHRFERVPNFGTGVAVSTTETLSVTRGAARMSIPAQFRFLPPTPICVTYTQPVSSNVGSLPPNATTSQRIQAQALDNIASAGGGGETTTRCDDFKFNVNVLAFPDTREVAFQRFCQSCDDKVEAAKTPEQRAREKQEDDLVRAIARKMDLPSTSAQNLPVGVRIAVQANSSQEERMDRYREMLERDPAKFDHIGWKDVPLYSQEVFANASMEGSAAVLQGTISEVKRHDATWTDVFFQESPDHKFILCTKEPGVLADLFGANYSTAMVGQKVEVTGLVTRCLGAPGILVKLQHQIKLVGTAPGMVAAVTPPPFKFPEDPNRRVITAVPLPGSVAYDSGKAAWARELLERHCKRLYTTRISLAQGPNTIADPELVKADAAACMERFDLAKLVPHEQAAIRYCVANHNFNAVPQATPQREAVFRAYSECVIQNDPVIIPCEEWRRITVNGRPPGDFDDCPPVPSRDEMEAILQGKQGPIPSAPPGLPAIQLPPPSVKAAMANAAGQSAPATAPPPPPVPAQVPAAAAPAAPAPGRVSPEDAAEQSRARAKAAQERAAKTQACTQEVIKQLGPNALSDPARFQQAVQACVQR